MTVQAFPPINLADLSVPELDVLADWHRDSLTLIEAVRERQAVPVDPTKHEDEG
ncbi:hypothetical protein BDK92_7087 [Micromonospora pisi]|uniref:Uncharacterized protein n=1 Tax=Micromonospora pisi TaxID=589240 RepID=A0A495JVS8_9ACTN|nr:hypothetical protein [Micromonospora pisi]RKR92645.1 hypothetical protein BDK92_7087 [Micromonospora pisi]